MITLHDRRDKAPIPITWVLRDLGLQANEADVQYCLDRLAVVITTRKPVSAKNRDALSRLNVMERVTLNAPYPKRKPLSLKLKQAAICAGRI